MGWLSALGSIASFLTKAIAFFQGLITRKDQIELGQAQQKTVDQDAALAAEARMNDAAAGPRGRDVTQKELDDGTF